MAFRVVDGVVFIYVYFLNLDTTTDSVYPLACGATGVVAHISCLPIAYILFSVSLIEID